ncbi:MAG: HAD family phosphatase [SAR324 cluster bacterium]|uniref:HAD family phosphatase n=1 Tax=SAR324 cluster bacterium TaxID=2024889 RepID=A0A7X9FQ70_9DELT|nr:HAD family phosphatase [SAR324 cluster bacterium]
MFKNLIFDLGGVLYEVDLSRTEQALRALQRDKKVFPKLQYNFTDGVELNCFDLFEYGRLSDNDFKNELKRNFNLQGNFSDIEAAWKAMLIGPYIENLEFLKTLKGQYRLFLLSNTNSIHIKYVRKIHPSLFDMFEKSYLSYELNMRKPERGIFEYALKNSGLAAHESLFIDDLPLNIYGAEELGISTLHVKDAKQLQAGLSAKLSGEN